MTDGNVDDDPGNDINGALDTCDFGSFPFACTGISWHMVPVPPGTAITRISLFDDYTDGNDDLDLYVWDAGFGFVGSSGSGTSAEQVDITFPASPFYFVAVHGWPRRDWNSRRQLERRGFRHQAPWCCLA